LKEIVTAGNCPWRLMESDSLRRWNWLIALKGTGVETTVPLLLLLPPPPPPPPPPLEEPVFDARVVPLVEVLALDEMLLVVLESTLLLVLDVEADESAEPVLTLESADGVLRLAEESAEVEDAGDERPPEVEGVNRELPEALEARAPAPEDEPAVFDAAPEEALPAGEDWM
jgi:hypothetical protein